MRKLVYKIAMLVFTTGLVSSTLLTLVLAVMFYRDSQPHFIVMGTTAYPVIPEFSDWTKRVLRVYFITNPPGLLGLVVSLVLPSNNPLVVMFSWVVGAGVPSALFWGLIRREIRRSGVGFRKA